MTAEDWVREYLLTEYLREQTDEGLALRLEELKRNLWSTDASGNVTPPRNQHNRQQLLKLITHACFEQARRSKAEFFEFDEGSARREATSGYSPPKLKLPFVGGPSCFAKFGKRTHILSAFEKGVLRVGAAGGFNDPSLNSAQRDDELLHLAITPNKQRMMKIYGLDDEGREVEIPVQKKEFFEGITSGEFYVWCCGVGYDARMFHDFGYDAVLVIRNKDEFRARFARAMRKVLPNAEMRDGHLDYYDPYDVEADRLKPIFSKHFKYLYQNEYRFAWLPLSKVEKAALFPELGPLSDIAEYYELDS